MKKKRIPDFKNEDEEREFWSTHDSIEYEMLDDAQVAAPANPLARTQPVTLRLSKKMLSDLQAISASLGVSQHRLIKEWLQEKIEDFAQAARAPKLARRR